MMMIVLGVKKARSRSLGFSGPVDMIVGGYRHPHCFCLFTNFVLMSCVLIY